MTAPVLTGERVLLRPIEERDREVRRSYGYHREIERGYGYLRESGPMSEAEAQQWYEGLLARGDETCWVIEVEGRLTGVVFLHAHEVADRRARLAIGFASPKFQGRGYGSEAVLLVLGHAFGALDLHRVDLRVLEFNTGAIACYLRCGFVEEGRQREDCLLEGEWYDDVLMGILDREYHDLVARGSRRD